jgi:hypothetical protein
MNLFLEQKINPSKSKLAKIFAIFLVCFFVGGAVNSALAQGYQPGYTNPGTSPTTPTINTAIASASTWGGLIQTYSSSQTQIFKNNNDGNKVYGVITTNVATHSFLDSITGVIPLAQFTTLASKAIEAIYGKKAVVYEIKPDGTAILVGDPSKLLWTPDKMTPLPIDPIQLNALANSPLTYDYAQGVYVYKDRTGAIETIDPADKQTLLDISREDERVAAATTVSTIKADTANQTVASNIASGASSQTDPKKLVENPCDWKNLQCFLAKGIYYITIQPASLFLGMSGWFLDSVLKYTVVDLRNSLSKNSKSVGGFYTVITMVWGIFRDIINMSFIFLLLYASIITILRADTSQLKKTISNIVIVAILINFSLFFVEIIIDVSNNAAVVIYNTITQPSTSQNNIAAAFMDKLELKTLLVNAMPTTTGGSTNFTGMIAISIFGSIFILVLAVIFFVMSILFVLRFVEFIILMMMSPVGVAGLAIPKLNEAFAGGNYWKNLLNQCFFAPIMLFFLWISIKMLDAIVNITKMASPGVGSATGSNPTGLSGMLTNGEQARIGIGGYLLGFTVIVFILIKGMAFAKTMSAKGASGMQAGFLKYSGADWLQNKMNNAPKGIAGVAGRNTIGRGATRIANSSAMRSLQSTAIGRFLKDKTSNVAKAGFGGKKGFSQLEEDAIKRKATAKKDLETYTLKEREDIDEQKQKTEEVKKQRDDLETHVKTTEAITLAENHDSKITDLQNKKEEAERDVAHAEHGGDANEIRIAKEKLSTAQKQIKDTDAALIKSFKNAGVVMKDATPEETLKALKSVYEKRNEIEKNTKGVDFTKGQAEIVKALDKIRIDADKENKELVKIEGAIKAKATSRVTNYTSNLMTPRLGNLGLPSRASRETALNIRKEARKSDGDKKEDKFFAELKKLTQSEPKKEEPKK